MSSAMLESPTLPYIEPLTGLQTRWPRRRLVPNSRRDHHVIKFRRNVLLQIIYSDVIHSRRLVPGMQDRFPLNETRRRHGYFRVLLQIDTRPRAPVSIRIVDVAATRKQLNVADSAKLRASPL